MPSVAVIITTYNRPVALDRVLDSVARQHSMPQQVIVADDGSDARTTKVIDSWRQRLDIPLHHVWQPDMGFRAAASRNRAARDAKADLLLFLDGDCLLRTGVIAEHLRLAEPGCAVAGNRILLSPRLTHAVEEGSVDPVGWQYKDWLQARINGDVERLSPLVRLPGHAWRRLRASHWLQVRSCNMSVFREDFERINGFEERISGWGFEDSDLAIRLINSGVKVKSGRFATAVLHLWHQERARDHAEHNRQRALQAKALQTIQADQGLRQRPLEDRFDPPSAGGGS
ncbi:MAG TPA: glycosyltransferase [Lautropia sp.]|nr:glycosyltransferase [Lautropia sp.]